MKKKLITLLFLSFSILLFAQAPDWQWVAQAGGSSGNYGYCIATDDNGNSYVTGSSIGTATFGSYSITSSGSNDVFVAKIDANGNWLWVSSAGGDIAIGRKIATDDNGNSYVTGTFRGTATFGSYSITSSGLFDVFVAKINANGNWLWATQAGGSGSNGGYGLATDNNGNIYLTGRYEGTATFGFYSITTIGYYDIFVAKMDAYGNWLWVSSTSGNGVDNVGGIAIDDIGNCYVTGDFWDTANFGSYSIVASSGLFDIFLAKMDANGNWLWATQVGGIGDNKGYAITIDDNLNKFVTGSFEDTATFGSYSITSSGSRDIFVAKMDANNNWLWATQSGGSGDDKGYRISVDNNGNSYVTGQFGNTATFGSYSITSSGNDDIFVAKMDANGNWLWAIQAGGSGRDEGWGIETDDTGNSYVAGFFYETATFGSYSLTSSGSWDIFVAKLGNEVSVQNVITPTKMKLSNYPNPFNPSSTISFEIQEGEKGIMSIFNLKGQLIESGEFNAGNHHYTWNADDQSTGLYFYQLKTEISIQTRRMLLLK